MKLIHKIDSMLKRIIRFFSEEYFRINQIN